MMIDEINRFLERYSSSKTQRTYGRSLVMMNDWLNQVGVGWSDLTPTLFLEFAAARQLRESIKYSTTYAVRAFVRWQYGDGHAAANISMKQPLAAPQRVLCGDQVAELLASIDTSTIKGRRDLAIVALMLDTGLRSAETCNLKLANVQLAKLEAVAWVKGGLWRTISYSAHTARYIDDWITIRRSFLHELSGVEMPAELFVSLGGQNRGQPLTPDGLSSMFRTLSRNCGITVSPHDLRRTFATLMLKNGASTRMVQVAGGWSSLAMVERYTQALRPHHAAAWLPIAKLMSE